ncbi:Mitochondrial translocator assembly and maintenance protein 41 [Entomortierella beljakovae]|nr:Mitochondrial translocator assembly and maintenance protein 41 [Entomortierella beljakovae]
MEWYLKSAGQGNANAQYDIGVLYHNGQGVPQDYSKAMEWYLKSAGQGNADAMINIGALYEDGHGVPNDSLKAMEWFNRASQGGNTKALGIMGGLYIGYSDIEQDFPKAIGYLLDGSLKSDSSANIFLGLLYKGGIFIPQDYSKAMHHFQLASEKDFFLAHYWIGVMYNYGYGVSIDYMKAKEMYHKAERQFLPAQTKIGLLYEEGNGVPQDYSEAMKWYTKAADGENAEAQCNIGRLYMRGHGVPQDYSKAMEWFIKASENKYTEAQFHLGTMYLNGIGVSQDDSEAFEWFMKAGCNGYVEAQVHLGDLCRDGRGTVKDYSKAMEWYRRAFHDHNVIATRKVAEMYESGQGVPMDRKIAIEWYYMAAMRGDDDSQSYLEKLYLEGTLIMCPATYVRYQKQGLRIAATWIPKEANSFSDSRNSSCAVTPVARYSTRQNSMGSLLSSVEAQSSSTLLSDQKRLFHVNNSQNASVEPNVDNGNNIDINVLNSNIMKKSAKRTTAPLRQHRPNFILDFEVPPDMSRLPPKFGDNQHIDIDAEAWEQLKSVVDTVHHKAPIRYAFAYGSGVFQQHGYDGKNKPMVDFIFGVTHPQHWHALNLQANPHHYSLLGKLGSKAIAMTQETFGAGVYFNPFVEVNGMIIKYGVVSIDTLCNDLLNWESMYLSGRLHKPVKILIDDPKTRLSNQVNLFNATRVATLMLPEKFTSEELFTKIAGLSYLGDFRMSIGENPHKVENIVKAQLAQFRRLYDPLLGNLSNVTYVRDGHLEQNMDPLVRSRTFHKLPPNLKKGVLYRYHSALSKAGLTIEKEDGQDLQSVATAPDLPLYFNKTVHSIVQIPAITQSIKGIATAGVSKTGKYGMEKLSKWWTRSK